MTKHLPPDQCNVPLNLTKRQRAILGREAFKIGVSQTYFGEQAIAAALREINPEAASEFLFEGEHRQRPKINIFANVALALLFTFSSLTGQIIRRASRLRQTVSIVRVIRAPEVAITA